MSDPPCSSASRTPSPRRGRGRHGVAASIVLLAFLGAACSGGGKGGDPKAPVFPEYSGADAITFDDVLAPALFGFDPQVRDPSTDPKLRQRTRRADYVMPVRVESLSRVGGMKGDGGYELTLSPTGPALAGDHAGPTVLVVPVGSPSYAQIEGSGASFAGAHLIVFVKTFRRGEDQIVHFRGEPDRPEVRKAIERDAALRLLR